MNRSVINDEKVQNVNKSINVSIGVPTRHTACCPLGIVVRKVQPNAGDLAANPKPEVTNPKPKP